MNKIPVDDEALRILKLTMEKAGLSTYSEAIRYLYPPRKRTEPDPAKERIVMAEPLFGSSHHQHSAWGADCPVCKNYFFEDSDTMPLPEEERPKECDSCGQKIRLIYPWEAKVGMVIG